MRFAKERSISICMVILNAKIYIRIRLDFLRLIAKHLTIHPTTAANHCKYRNRVISPPQGVRIDNVVHVRIGSCGLYFFLILLLLCLSKWKKILHSKWTSFFLVLIRSSVWSIDLNDRPLNTKAEATTTITKKQRYFVFFNRCTRLRLPQK